MTHSHLIQMALDIVNEGDREMSEKGLKERVKEGLPAAAARQIASEWDYQPAIDKFNAWLKQYKGGSQPSTNEGDEE
jgi:hypothetical protein